MTTTADDQMMAFERARVRAQAAALVEAVQRWSVIAELRGEGLSVRDIARRLGLPKSTVTEEAKKPLWKVYFDGLARATPGEYVAAHNAVWSHDVTQQIGNAPFGVQSTLEGDQIRKSFTLLAPAGVDQDGRRIYG